MSWKIMQNGVHQKYRDKTQDNKYIMSLDSLDLALLPNICSSMLKTKTLWTVNHSNLNNNNYFEFEIIPKTESTISNGNDSSTSSESVCGNNSHQNLTNKSRLMPTELTAKTTCHLCDIDIPKAYIAEHENSLKHKAHLKLANVLLNRTRKHMLQKSTEYVQKNDNSHFCGPCASEIQLVNKANHDKCKAHKQSVSLDRILYELVALYTDEDQKREESDELADKTFDTTEDQETEVNYSNTVVISDIRARLEEFETKSYIQMIDECDEDKPYVLSGAGNDVRIAMENGREIIVAENNFNGFVIIDESFTMCVLCKMIFHNEEAHKTTDMHIKNVCMPFKDHHCLRNLDSSAVHCVICNKIVNNVSLHISCDETHKDLLQKAVVVKENKPVETTPKDILVFKNESYKNSETDNTVCKENEINKNNETISNTYNRFGDESNHDSISKDIEGNRLLKSPKTADNKKAVETEPAANVANSNVTVPVLNGRQKDDNTFHCYPCNLIFHVNNITSHMNGNKHINNSKSKYHYIMKPDIGYSVLICRVCNLDVGDDANDVKEHVTMSDHIKRYNELLSVNYIQKKTNSFYCEPCDSIILKRNEFYHIEKPNHEAMLVNFIKAETRAVEPDKVEEVGRENNIKEMVTDDSKSPRKIPPYYCAVCNVYVPNNPKNISEHNNGDRHRTNASNTEFEDTDAVESNSSDDEVDEFYEMEATDVEKTVMCKVCQVVLPNVYRNITQHILGEKHKVLLEGMEYANNMERYGDKYYCKDCKIYVKTQNLFKHINGIQHKASPCYFLNGRISGLCGWQSMVGSRKLVSNDSVDFMHVWEKIKETIYKHPQ